MSKLYARQETPKPLNFGPQMLDAGSRVGSYPVNQRKGLFTP